MSTCTDTCCRPGHEDYPEVIDLGERDVKARKEHRCAHCSTPIKPGERYVRRAFRVDGDVVVEKSHTGSGWCADYADDDEFDRIVAEEAAAMVPQSECEKRGLCTCQRQWQCRA